MQEGFGLGQPPIAGELIPKRRTVVCMNEMGQLMQQDVVHHPIGHALELVGKSDGAPCRRCRTPPGGLVSDPSYGGGHGSPAQILGGEFHGPDHERLVALTGTALRRRRGNTALQPAHHARNPIVLILKGQACRDGYDGLPALPEGA